jgi:hypothetical protein
MTYVTWCEAHLWDFSVLLYLCSLVLVVVVVIIIIIHFYVVKNDLYLTRAVGIIQFFQSMSEVLKLL